MVKHGLAVAALGAWDVVQVEADELEIGCEEGLYDKLDWAALGGKDKFLPGHRFDAHRGAALRDAKETIQTVANMRGKPKPRASPHRIWPKAKECEAYITSLSRESALFASRDSPAPSRSNS